MLEVGAGALTAGRCLPGHWLDDEARRAATSEAFDVLLESMLIDIGGALELEIRR